MINLNSPIKPNLRKLNVYLEKINNNNWYTNFGPCHEELSANLEEYLGVENLLLVNNGTTALQVAGLALGTESVVSTPFSFVATASAFTSQGKNVCFSDIDINSLNLCPKKLNKFKFNDVDTVIATHVYGNPCDVDEIEQVAKTNDKKIIYDAAHAFGVKVNDRSVLTYGDASTLSFHATKVYHTIEGGGIVFKDKSKYEIAKNMINFGINPLAGTVSPVGINGKMNEYQCAVGLVNLEIIQDVIDYRSALFCMYREQLDGYVELPTWHQGASLTGAYMPILFDNRVQLDKVATKLSLAGISSRNYFNPSLETIYSPGEYMVNSRSVSERILCLPMHANLKMEDVYKVIEAVKRSVK